MNPTLTATTHPKRRSLLLSVIGVLALLGTLVVAAPARAAETSTLTVSVRVEPNTRVAAGDATVRLRLWTGTTWGVSNELSTDANGEVAFTGLTAGTMYLTQTLFNVGDFAPVWGTDMYAAPDLTTSAARSGTVAYEGQPQYLIATARAYRTLTGSLTMPDGSTPADGTIQVTARRLWPLPAEIHATADLIGGSFFFSGLVATNYSLTITADETLGLLDSYRTVALANGSATVTYQLKRSFTISGHVDRVASGSSAGEGVQVSAQGTTVSTDADGDYVITGLQESSNVTVSVGAVSPRWLPVSTTVTLAGTTDPVVDLVQRQVRGVEGHVTDSAGNPLEGAWVNAVRIRDPYGYYNGSTGVRTDADGYYYLPTPEHDVEIYFTDFGGPTPGDYATTAWSGFGGYYQADRIDLSDNVVAVADGVMYLGASITGRVTVPGGTAADVAYMGALIFVYDYAEAAWVDVDYAELDASGNFRFGDLYPDDYGVVVYYDGPKGIGYYAPDVLSVDEGETAALGALSIPLESGAPVNSTPPTVSGSTAIGSTWTLNTGTWTGSPTPTIVQAWLRCTQPITTTFTAVPSGCVAISGASGTSYVSTSADAGKYLTAQVAGINSRGTTNIVAFTTVATAGPVAPKNTAAPTVSGNTAVGSTWTLNKGTWTGTPTPTIVQAWLRCNAPVTTNVVAVPAGCVAVSGGSGTSYVSTSADAGKYITAQVAGINSAGATNIVALTTVATAGPTLPKNTVAPTVSGNTAVGSTWTLNKGTWTGTPAPTIVQAWLRCNAPVTTNVVAVPAGCVAVSGGSGTSYVSTSADAGKYITAQVAGINSAGATNIVALTTVATVGPVAPAATVAPTVSGNPNVGSTWTLNTGTWSGSPTRIVQAWLRCSSPVTTNVVAVPAGCVAVSNGSGTSYVSTSADAGKYITAQVAGINSAGATNIVALTTVATVGPVAPAATVAPTVSGAATVGSTWTLNTGTWSGSPTRIVQAWLRCNAPVTTNVVAVPAGCVAISGGSGTSYVSTSADAGKYITAQVAGINSAGVTNIVALTTVATVGPTPPAATVAPTVSGAATVGSTWTLNTGTWSGSPTKIIQAWLRCTAPVTTNVVAVPAGCVAISGGSGTSYVSTSADAGKYITAQVAAFNPAGVTNVVALTTVATG